jgi:hypothetical protein
MTPNNSGKRNPGTVWNTKIPNKIIETREEDSRFFQKLYLSRKLRIKIENLKNSEKV